MAGKRVRVYYADTDELYKEFESVKQCAQYFDKAVEYISNNIRGKTKTIIGKQYYCKVVDKIYYQPIVPTNPTHTPKVIDVYKDREFIDTFDNAKLAANATGVPPNSIYRYCRGEVKKPIRGYTFKYNYKRQQEKSKRAVDLYDIETDELYKSFDSVEELADFLGLTKGTILTHLRGGTRTLKVRSFYAKYRNE